MRNDEVRLLLDATTGSELFVNGRFDCKFSGRLTEFKKDPNCNVHSCQVDAIVKNLETNEEHNGMIYLMCNNDLGNTYLAMLYIKDSNDASKWLTSYTIVSISDRKRS